MTKPHSINLKGITLGWFLLLSVLCPVKNIATNSNNGALNQQNINPNNVAMNHHNNRAADEHENNIIKTVTEKILGKNGYLFGFRGNIIDWIGASIYNHYTEHNSRRAGWYHGKFFIYGGRKFEITKNVYLDVYYSLLKLIPFFIIDVKIISPDMADWFFLSLLTISINIRINKIFYLSISPIVYILFKLIGSSIIRSYAKHS